MKLLPALLCTAFMLASTADAAPATSTETETEAPLVDWLALNTMQERWDLVRSHYKKYDVITYAEVTEVKETGGKRELTLLPYRMYKSDKATGQPIAVTLHGTKEYTKGDYYLFYVNQNKEGNLWLGDDNRVIPDYLAVAESQFLLSKMPTLNLIGNTQMTCPDYIKPDGKVEGSQMYYFPADAKLLHSIITPDNNSCVLIFEELSTKQKFGARFGSSQMLEKPSKCPAYSGKNYKLYLRTPLNENRTPTRNIVAMCETSKK